MNTEAAERQLTQWAGEYRHISDPEFSLPEPFLRFCGLRLAQLIHDITPPENRDDWNVVQANVNGQSKRVRIGRLNRAVGKLMYDFADPGSVGMGMMNVEDVHPDYRQKLATILDRIEGT